jgi:tetratricopeptide (TPR) repeat protein
MAEQLNVFVSHSHQDDAFCHALVDALRGAGADVWYDEHNMGSGQLGPTIERELRTRPVFVLILSPAALASSWVEDEARWAYGFYRNDRTRTILPVLAAALNENDIWVFLRDFKRIEAAGIQPYPQLEAVQRTLDALGLVAPGPVAPEHVELAAVLVERGKALRSSGYPVYGMPNPGGYPVYGMPNPTDAEALSLFQRATQLDPSSLDAWLSLAIALQKLKRPQEALTALENAINIRPNDASVWISLAAVWIDLGRSEEALSAAEKAISLDRTEPAAWSRKAEALKALGRAEEAEVASDEATVAHPEPEANVILLTQRAFAFVHLGRTDEAQASVEKAISLKSDDVEAWNHIARLLNLLERYEEALAAAENALSLNRRFKDTFWLFRRDWHSWSRHESWQRNEVSSWTTKADALNRLGRFKEALSAAGKAIALGSSEDRSPVPWECKAVALRGLKRMKDAEEAEAKAKALRRG